MRLHWVCTDTPVHVQMVVAQDPVQLRPALLETTRSALPWQQALLALLAGAYCKGATAATTQPAAPAVAGICVPNPVIATPSPTLAATPAPTKVSSSRRGFEAMHLVMTFWSAGMYGTDLDRLR